MAERGRIARLGSGGDGIVDAPGGPRYVPYALPGEEVCVEPDGSRAILLSVEHASPDRVMPPCRYFGRCGGCAMQHLADAPYAEWKRGKVVAALAGIGLTPEVAPLLDAHGDGRRRLVLHARRTPDGEVAVGLMEARSHRLVPIEACPVACADLAGAPAAARRLAVALAGTGKPLDLAVSASEGGLDIDLRGTGPLPEGKRRKLIGLAGELDLARLSLHGEVLVERRPPIIAVGPARVKPPPGAFLQATAAGEQALADAVLEALAGQHRVADLFAGIGPFALRLAISAEVHAVESDAAMLAALDRAARATPGLRRVTTETRDLFRRPLLPTDLARFDAVVLDPPRAGAEAQTRQIAASSLGLVAMVSCDAGTFSRDAAILTASGFGLDRVLPIDQFRFSPHVEIVGVFRRSQAAKRRPRR